MGNSDSVIPSEVRDLIQESQKIRGWVDALGEHASEARPEVVEKVRSDYEDRLQTVNAQLSEHRVSLVATLETRRSEVASLREDRDEHAAELEEARLRHAVGEFTDSDWKKRKEGVEQTLEDLDGLLGLEEETVSELADIIDRIGATGPRLVIDEPGAADEAEEVEAADGKAATEVGIAAVLADADDADDEVLAVDEDSAQEEEAVADAPEEIVAEQPTEDAETDAPAASDATKTDEAPAETVEDDAETGEYLDELEFLESLSLGDSDRFDAVSAMLDEEEGSPSSD